jgi:hypothetical protein
VKPPHAESAVPEPPRAIGGFVVQRGLGGDRTLLAVGPGGRRAVLKQIDDDCLLGGDLHPSIRLRLARVRELPSLAVASLLGVWRDGPAAWMAWEFLPGRPLAELSTDPLARSGVDWPHVLREVALALEAMHALGLVHGAVHAGNVIVDGRSVRLTHASPLLFDDPKLDEGAAIDLVRQLASALQAPPLEELATRAARSRQPLRVIATHDVAVPPKPDPAAISMNVSVDVRVARRPNPRRRALWTALAVAALGLAGAGVAAYLLSPPADDATAAVPPR